jgi:hypothetical protein
MRLVRRTSLVALAVVMFLVAMTLELYPGPTSCSRDPVPGKSMWGYSTDITAFHIDYGGVWSGKDANTNVLDTNTGLASVLTAPALAEVRSSKVLLRSSEANAVISTTIEVLDPVGCVRGEDGATVAMTVGSSSDESTLLYSGQRPDAPGRMRRSASRLDGSASISDHCPVVGDLHHPRLSSSVTLNRATA